MLFQLIIGPFSTLHTLPKGMSALLLTLTAIISSISLGVTGVKAGQTRAPEIANITISFVFIALSLLGFVWQFGWHRLEDNFDCLPWLPLVGAKQGLPCPFTGKRPDKRCPSCGCLVHATAFHLQERLTTFYVGESVLGWDKANHAGNMDHDGLKSRIVWRSQYAGMPSPKTDRFLTFQFLYNDQIPSGSTLHPACASPASSRPIASPEEGRALLDEALDWRGNYYFGCTGNGCVGCSSHQRLFRMLPRWALILACIASVGSLVPWAFKGSLLTVAHGGKIQAIAETYGVFFSLTAVFIQLHSISCAVVFMTSYHTVLPFPSPVILPKEGVSRVAVEFMAGQRVARHGTWKPATETSLLGVWKQLSSNLSSLPAQLDRHLDKMKNKGSEGV